MVTFIIGGMTGVLMAVPPADFVLHNSLFLVAHFHNVIIGGVLFGAFAGYTYWFPKAFGFRLARRLGQGGVLVLARRLLCRLHAALCPGPARHDAADAALRRAGMAPMADRGGRAARSLIMVGIVLQIVQLVVSIRHRAALRDETGDPWDGRSLEWATASPPPAFNFAVLPTCRRRGRLLGASSNAPARAAQARQSRDYRDIEMPRNSPTGFVCAFFATMMGFALIWHIWWMVVVGAIGAFATFVVFAWRDQDEYVDPGSGSRADRSRNIAARAVAAMRGKRHDA